MAGIVFGSSLKEATRYHLAEIGAGQEVLILGGGTGDLLDGLRDMKIDYLEKSSKMIDKAKRRSRLADTRFIHADFLEWNEEKTYDWVICPFFLDVFNQESLRKVILKIRTLLKPEGKVIVTDFTHTQLRYHKLLLQVMHTFFRVVSSLESKELRDIKGEMIASGFQLEFDYQTLNKFVNSAIYKKAPY